MGKIERFFASDTVKHIFDNIRNLGLSAVVLITGGYLVKTVTPTAQWPGATLTFGYTLIACGFILMFICTLHGYFLLKKSMFPLIASMSISFIYFVLATVLFLTTLKAKGITLEII